MEESLFKRLCEAHPAAVASLTVQYRMNSDIMQLANKVTSLRFKAKSDRFTMIAHAMPCVPRSHLSCALP